MDKYIYFQYYEIKDTKKGTATDRTRKDVKLLNKEKCNEYDFFLK